MNSIVFRNFVELSGKKMTVGEMLASLSNAELRDNLGTTNRRNRREILAAIARAYALPDTGRNYPEFGRILVHLSN